MNTNEQTQTTVEYVHVNSRQPMMLANLVGDGVNEIVAKEGSKVFFNKDYPHTLQDGTIIQINITFIDIEEGSGDFVVAIGGEVKDHIVDGFTKDLGINVAYSAQLLEALKGETSLPPYLKNISLLTKTPDLCRTIRDHERQRRSERVSGRDDREMEAIDSIQQLLNTHLDDIIAQANVLKTSDQPMVRSDAYARIRFAMARLEGLEHTIVYGVRHRSMTHEKASEADRRQREERREVRYRHGRVGLDVDRVYRQSDDSYYTPGGQFIETNDEASAKAWYGDASHESMERLRREREITESEREDRYDRRRRGYSRD